MNIVSFDKENFKVRVVEKEGEDLFYAIDVAQSLGYRDTDQAIRKNIFKEYIISPVSKKGSPVLLKEPGLYQLICKSKKPEAVEFQKWVFGEVLPCIRKTGRYEMRSCLQKLKDIEKNLTRQSEESKDCRPIVININNNLKNPSRVEAGEKGGKATAKKHRDNENRLVDLEEKLASIVEIVNE